MLHNVSLLSFMVYCVLNITYMFLLFNHFNLNLQIGKTQDKLYNWYKTVSVQTQVCLMLHLCFFLMYFAFFLTPLLSTSIKYILK